VSSPAGPRSNENLNRGFTKKKKIVRTSEGRIVLNAVVEVDFSQVERILGKTLL